MPPKNWQPHRLDASISAQATVSVSQLVASVVVQSWPHTAIGRLFFMNREETEYYSCSATSIVSRTRNAVWTAGHCLHRGSGGGAGWYANHVFIPAYERNSNPFGWWYGASLLATAGWTDNGDLRDADMGALVVVPETGSAKLQDTVGAWGYDFNGATAYSNVRSYGYPAQGYNRPDSDFADGEYMRYCEGNTVDAANGNPLDNRLQIFCDMGGGSSDGPLVRDILTSPRIIGTNSHRYLNTNGGYLDNRLFSSNHRGNATAVINGLNS